MNRYILFVFFLLISAMSRAQYTLSKWGREGSSKSATSSVTLKNKLDSTDDALNYSIAVGSDTTINKKKLKLNGVKKEFADTIITYNVEKITKRTNEMPGKKKSKKITIQTEKVVATVKTKDTIKVTYTIKTKSPASGKDITETRDSTRIVDTFKLVDRIETKRDTAYEESESNTGRNKHVKTRSKNIIYVVTESHLDICTVPRNDTTLKIDKVTRLSTTETRHVFQRPNKHDERTAHSSSSTTTFRYNFYSRDASPNPIIRIADSKTIFIDKLDSFAVNITGLQQDYIVPNVSRHRFITDTLMSKSAFKRMYREKHMECKPKAVVLYASMMNGWTNRIISINSSQFTNQPALTVRRNKEHAGYGVSAAIGLRYRFMKIHSIYAEGLYMQQGFIADSLNVDWNTGLPGATKVNNQKYLFDNAGFSIGYNVTGYKYVANPSAEIGFYSVWNNDKGNNVRPQTWGIKVASGLLLRTNKSGISFSIMPTLYFNFQSLNKEILRTNLYSFGITTGVAKSFSIRKK